MFATTMRHYGVRRLEREQENVEIIRKHRNDAVADFNENFSLVGRNENAFEPSFFLLDVAK